MPAFSFETLKDYLIRGALAGLITGVFTVIITQANLVNLLFGILIGVQAFTYISIFEALLRPQLNKRSFLLALLASTISYILLIVFAVFLAIMIINRFDMSFFTQGHYREFFSSVYMLYGVTFGLIMSFLFNAYSMFDTLLGKNFLWKIFTGKYHRPFEEKRIFMFLDIKSSTSIAEKLGHKTFLSLLNDFFFDLAEPVAATNGEIYKYVGDEAIISWKANRKLHDAAPLQCFFDMQKRIARNSRKYFDRYGIVPEFKAGVHGGAVVTGEMGFIKKEIAYLGDVINTAARIQAACNDYGKKLIVSDQALEMLTINNQYFIGSLGDIVFKGKEIPVAISSVEEPAT